MPPSENLFSPILVCSAVAEEGIGLQKRRNTVIHYDLEWNLAKVERREGRVGRLGRNSSEQVKIHTFSLINTYDERILARCNNRRRWMDLYLCREWKDQGKRLETEIGLPTGEDRLSSSPDWLAEYQLNLSPEPLGPVSTSASQERQADYPVKP